MHIGYGTTICERGQAKGKERAMVMFAMKN